MAVGVLNLVAVANEWNLEDTFDWLDLPITLAIAGDHQFGFPPTPWNYGYTPSLLVIIIAYWIFLGVLVAMLICGIRGGAVGEVVHDKIWRRTLLLGSGAGMLAGGLNCLAAINEWWQVERYSYVFDRPLILLLGIADQKLQLLPRSDAFRDLNWLLAIIAYWTTIGMLLAPLVCAIQILRKKRRAAEA